MSKDRSRQWLVKGIIRMENRQPNGKIHHRFWQRGGGYDRNLWEPKAIYQQIEYMHCNPVQRHLCEKPEAWQ